jgi:hypothetical protein
MNRAQVKSLIRTYLGTGSDDPAFSDAVLEPVIQNVVYGLIAELHLANRSYLAKSVTLAADGAASHVYTFGSQSPAITDFAYWLEVRLDDADGSALEEVRLDELNDAYGDSFALSGPDGSVVLTTSKGTTAGTPLFLKYGYWPAALTSDSDAIPGLPAQFHEVVALESLFLFGVGNEGQRPPELRERWMNQRAALWSHVGTRGVQPSRTRVA